MSDDAAERDLTRLWDHVEGQFALGAHSLHGPSHWRRVERHGRLLAAGTRGADLLVVRLFAVLHDSKRIDEGTDWGHGERGAELAKALRGKLFALDDARLRTLVVACEGHEKGRVSDDPTVGACWDADRLDLTRVGARPDERYMSTATGKELARASRG
jgi:uncharacterized protein